MVKLQILSDLHLSVQEMAPVVTDADIVILAGDVARPPAAMAWARRFAKPVVYVPGNHEFYGASLPETVAQLQDLAQGSQVHVLDNQAVVLHGVRFLGSTLWTDFQVAGTGAQRDAAMAQSIQFNRDFSRIRLHGGADAPLFTPQDSAVLFARNARWLDSQLAAPFSGPTVVVTHHAPALPSVAAQFAGSPLNVNFVSDASWLLAGRRAALWIHGHMHHRCDYTVDGTRVLCNPRGYAREGVPENPEFDPAFTVELVVAESGQTR